MENSQSTDAGSVASRDVASDRRQKKRELDRKAQRMARERTKNRIAYLESIVNHLQEYSAGRGVESMMSHLSNLTRDRQRLLDTLRSVEETIQKQLRELSDPELRPAEQAGTPTHPVSGSLSTTYEGRRATAQQGMEDAGSLGDVESRQPVHFDMENWGREGLTDVPGRGGNPSVGQGLDLQEKATAPISSMAAFETIPELHLGQDRLLANFAGDPIVPASTTLCDCFEAHSLGLTGPQQFNIWRAVNEALGRRTRISRVELEAEGLSSADTAIQVVLQGWVEMEHAGKLTPAWRKIRRVDEICFQKTLPTERLAILATMHRIFLYHGNPTVERRDILPRWLWDRPSQAIPHSYGIDFFVWPGVRERFIFAQHSYCRNLFWELFQASLKILWPFDLRDCYMHNRTTNQYQFSPPFEQRIRDINSWTMATDFLNEFPEFYEDMPLFLGVPRNLPDSLAATAPTPRVAETDREPEGQRAQVAVTDSPSDFRHDGLDMCLLLPGW
ncbi:hypothetical protein GQ53DRAFT_639450 [Thozetella sp. PMI_491]|nr:hypothetical protein GQ53DRAFT_639450 [Thozetella sp. PMI_491]